MNESSWDGLPRVANPEALADAEATELGFQHCQADWDLEPVSPRRACRREVNRNDVPRSR